MKKIDPGQSIQILANIGVIAGIVFLGYELRQNNDILETQARAERAAVSREASLRVLDNADLRRAIMKARQGEELDQSDILVLELHNQRTILDWSYIYQEVQRNTLDESALNVANWRRGFRNQPMLAEHWSNTKADHESDFQEWMDETIVN